MKRRFGWCVGQVVAFLFATGAQAQSLNESPIILRSGAWDVHRTTDAMTDAVVCTAVYNSEFAVQMSENMLTIASPDGVKRVRLRFDNDAALPDRLATRSEIHNNRIEIDGADFAALLQSRRLRYEALTMNNGSVSGDINLSGAYEAHGNVAAGCAGNAIVMPNPPAQPADNCSAELRQRMADQGIPAANIDKICRG